jgi:putative membrane protein
MAQPEHAPLELSMRQTGLSFQRTRMSADRTLMSVIRTSLSLISFGFTIFQFFRHLEETKLVAITGRAPRNFGGSLVVLGVGMLVVGIFYHVQFMLGLRHMRSDLKTQGLVHGESKFPVSLTLIVAVLLLVVGLLAMASIAFKSGPFL